MSSIEIAPVAWTCDIGCGYCYENPMRDAGNSGNNGYDFDAITRAVDGVSGDFTLFGGEALLAPERINEPLRLGFEKTGVTDLQTNDSLINDDHIRMFLRYNARVGVSLGGADKMDDLRWAGTLEKTRRTTAATEANIRRLREAGISVSIIANLHTLNTGRT